MRSSPASGFSWPMIMRNSVVLPAPFGPMMPTMPPRGRLNDRLSISSRSPKLLLRPFASTTRSPRRGRDEDFLGFVARLEILRRHFLVTLQACLAFGVPALGVLTHPLKLLF